MMRKPDTILDEIHAIRHKINETTKDMNATERTTYFNKHGEVATIKYGFKRVVNARENEYLQVN